MVNFCVLHIVLAKSVILYFSFYIQLFYENNDSIPPSASSLGKGNCTLLAFHVYINSYSVVMISTNSGMSILSSVKSDIITCEIDPTIIHYYISLIDKCVFSHVLKN